MSEQESYRVTAAELRQFVERVEQVEAEIADANETKKEVFAEAKARGYDVKVLRKIIAERKRDANDLAEEQAVAEMYREALGIGGEAVVAEVKQILDDCADAIGAPGAYAGPSASCDARPGVPA